MCHQSLYAPPISDSIVGQVRQAGRVLQKYLRTQSPFDSHSVSITYII